MLRQSGTARQAAINLIAGYLVQFQVRSTHDLSVHLKQILLKINQDPKVFGPTDTFLQRTEIFTAAVAAYARVTEYNIKVPADLDWNLLQAGEKAPVSGGKISPPQKDDVDIVSASEEKRGSKRVGKKKGGPLGAGREPASLSVAAVSLSEGKEAAPVVAGREPASLSVAAVPPSEDKEAAPLATYAPDESALEDLSKVTHSYDHLVSAIQTNKKTSRKITAILESKDSDFSVCDSIIFGAGDTGTTLWLEKYKAEHGTSHQALAEQKLPGVIIIADSFGGWRHDYTLAQTQSSLERSTAVKNPGDFLPTLFYQKNPQANARHIYQANHVCLAATQAPVVKLQMLRIEKRENHAEWESREHAYRCLVQLPNGRVKAIYTNQVDVCTGLGAANLMIEEKVLPRAELRRLNQFDERLGFTPIVDGNQFVLTSSEEGKNDRTILIYGGGGTASACYRKCFFGTDIRTYDRPFTAENQRNEVLWVYRDFIGTGKMAANALGAAKARKAVFQGQLVQITQKRDGKLGLRFMLRDSSGVSTTYELVCDQLIYSIGQDDFRTKEICREVSAELWLNYDKSGMPLYVSTPDKRVSYFGAAAVSFSKVEFNKQTMAWLEAQNIGGDVGPGSMPPTRAQVKRHLALQGLKPVSINVNMDTSALISEYLLEAGVDKAVAHAFIGDLLLARKDDTYGFSRAKLQHLLKRHRLDPIFDIYGHSHLVIKGTPPGVRSGLLSSLYLLGSSKLHSPRTVVDDMKAQAPAVYGRAFKADLVQPSASVQKGRDRVFFEVVRRPSIAGDDDSFALVSKAALPPMDPEGQARPKGALALPGLKAIKSGS